MEGQYRPIFSPLGITTAMGYYMEACKRAGIKPHPARFPIQVPQFFLRFLTDPSDLVLDPFAGSNTTGEACEREGRKWMAIELNESYLDGSRFRFERKNLENLLPFKDDIPDKTKELRVVSLFD
jgi:DNA modification methylase